MNEFNFEFGKELIENQKINRKLSMRIVVYENGRFLMLKTHRGDLTFPGGGIEGEETFEEAAERELVEETGYMPDCSLKYLGMMMSWREDRYNDDELFELESHYYICNVTREQTDVKHTASELALQIEPVWLTREEILRDNEVYLDRIKKKRHLGQ